jgi:hypothetical protein
MLKFGCGTVNMTLIAVLRFSWPVTCAPQKVHRKNSRKGHRRISEESPLGQWRRHGDRPVKKQNGQGRPTCKGAKMTTQAEANPDN